jgi:hypothetical protein
MKSTLRSLLTLLALATILGLCLYFSASTAFW